MHMITIINQINITHHGDALYRCIKGLFCFINFSLKLLLFFMLITHLNGND